MGPGVLPYAGYISTSFPGPFPSRPKAREKTLGTRLGYICMCGPEGYGFSAVLVINKVSILANFDHFGHKLGMVFVLFPCYGYFF